MSSLLLQTRYAKSLFVLAKEMNQNEEVFLDMKNIENVCRENRLLRSILKNPTIKPLKKKAILQELFTLKISPISMQFLALLSSKRRDVYLMEIAAQYIALYKEDKGIKTVKITTASEISSQISIQLADILRKELASEIEMLIQQKSSLIGGIKIEIEDKIYDASLLKSLSTLRQLFSQNIYESSF